MIVKVTNSRNRSELAEGKYELHYLEGEVVRALPNTLGIFCYDTDKRIGVIKKDILYLGFKVFEVIGMNKLYEYPKVCNIISEFSFDEYYRELKEGFREVSLRVKKRDEFASKVVTFESIRVVRQLSIKDIESLDIRLMGEN